MSQKPKFDPSLVANLLSRGAEEGGGPLSERTAAPVLSSVPPAPPASASGDVAGSATAVEPEASEVVAKRPVTVRLTEEVLHALVRHQAEVRCKPGARLGDTTIGGVMDALLRGPLGLPS